MNEYYRFLDIGLRISSRNRKFGTFAKKYLSGFNIDDGSHPVKFAVNSSLEPSTKIRILPTLQINQRIHLDEARVVWGDSEITADISIIDGTAFQIEIYLNKSIETLLRQVLLRRRYSKAHQFQTALRSMFHFPIFYILEKYYNIHLLHGSALAKNDAGIILCGLAGVGKSTLSMELILKRGYKHLTDNYVLFGSDKVYGFPEPIRIDKKAIRLISRAFVPKDNFKVNNRSYFVLPTDLTIPEANINRIFFTVLSSESRISKINNYAASNIMTTTNNYVREFHDSTGFIGFNWNTKAEASVQENRMSCMQDMLSKAESFLLEVNRGNLSETAEMVDDFVKHS